MALPDLTGQNIENTYQRVLQTDGTVIYDGTGSVFLPISASYAVTASYALNSPDVFPYTGSAIISGSLEVTGNITASGDLSISGFPSVSSSLALATTNVFDYARAIMGNDVLQGGVSQQNFDSATAQKVKFNTSADTEGTNITIDTTNN